MPDGSRMVEVDDAAEEQPPPAPPSPLPSPEQEAKPGGKKSRAKASAVSIRSSWKCTVWVRSPRARQELLRARQASVDSKRRARASAAPLLTIT